jgi:membrane fusion protein
MPECLFRPQAMEARRVSWLGSISIAQPLSLPLLTAAAVLAAAVIVLFLIAGEYTRRSRVAGQLVPDLGLATVVAPVAGVVLQPMPQEGTGVQAGQALVVISAPRPTTESADTTTALLDRLQRQRAGLEQTFLSRSALLDVRRTGFESELQAARRELAKIESAIGIQEQRVAIADDLLAHYQALAAEHYVSKVDLTRQQEAGLEQVAALQQLHRQAAGLQRSIVQIRQNLEALPAERSLQAALRTRELAALERQRLQVLASGEILVKAPVSGLITSRLIERGQAVQAGQSLLSLLPTGSVLQARLMVPSRAVGFIEPGDPVILRYPAFPHQKFGHYHGTVLRISRNALSPQGPATAGGDMLAGEPSYRVLVTLAEQSVTAYGKLEPLRPGMRVEADILGERRKLYEWLLEPLFSLTGEL